jgi:hypothetical protein
MSTLSQFTGGGVTTSIVNGYEAGGLSGATGLAVGKEALSGALTANTFATIAALNISGSGEVPMLACYSKDATSRTLRMRVTVDGVVVFNPAASAAITAANAGLYAAGEYKQVSPSNWFGPSLPIRFSSSLLVEVASSLTETDKVAVGYILHRT